MRALLLLGGLLVLMVGLVTWKIARPEAAEPKSSLGLNQGELVLGVEAGREQPLSPPASDEPGAGEASAATSPARPAAGLGEEDDRRSHAGGDPPAGHGPAPAAQPAAGEPETPSATATAGEPLAYVVRDGDTLYSLVRRAYGTADERLIEAVADASGLADPALLAVGHELRFPVVAGYPAPRNP